VTDVVSLSFPFLRFLPSHRFSIVQDIQLYITVDISNLHIFTRVTVYVGSLQ